MLKNRDVIRRYGSNRRMYCPHAKKYITLLQVASRIRTGEQPPVESTTTGKDCTAVTYASVVLELTKAGQIGIADLVGLIRKVPT